MFTPMDVVDGKNEQYEYSTASMLRREFMKRFQKHLTGGTVIPFNSLEGI